MKLPGYKPDHALAEQLLQMQLRAAPLAPGMPRHPVHARALGRALINAWEAGRLCPVINTNLSEEDTNDAI